MKPMIVAVAAATLAALSTASFAQTGAPAAPPLSATQSQQVQKEMDAYRRETDARLARGDITPDEAQRLLQWREWQLAQKAAGLAPPAASSPQRVVVAPPPRVIVAPPPPYYAYPYYAPYYAAPWWRVSVCAGRGFRHGFASFCI